MAVDLTQQPTPPLSDGEGFAGATVIHGVAGFGASSVIHTASLVEVSSDLPVLFEVIEDEAHVERLLPISYGMGDGRGARDRRTGARREKHCRHEAELIGMPPVSSGKRNDSVPHERTAVPARRPTAKSTATRPIQQQPVRSYTGGPGEHKLASG